MHPMIDEDQGACPCCGQPRVTDVWVYPRMWACGTTLEEWKQGYGATDPVPVRSAACSVIEGLAGDVARLTRERDELRVKDLAFLLEIRERLDPLGRADCMYAFEMCGHWVDELSELIGPAAKDVVPAVEVKR